jgi:hypothetical protein
MSAESKLGTREAVRGVNRGAKLSALGTKPAEVGCGLGDAANSFHFTITAFECQPAADAAIRTDRFAQRFHEWSFCATTQRWLNKERYGETKRRESWVCSGKN